MICLSLKNLDLRNFQTSFVEDISNLFSENKVAGMIYVNNGEFIRSKYRRYIIEDKTLTSDYDCMKHIIGNV